MTPAKPKFLKLDIPKLFLTDDCFSEAVVPIFLRTVTLWGKGAYNSKKVTKNHNHPLAFAKEKKIYFMLDVIVHCHSRQTAQAKHDLRARFCFYERHREHRPFLNADLASNQIADVIHQIPHSSIFSIIQSSNVKTFCLQPTFSFIFCIWFKAALLETLHCPNKNTELL